MTITIPTIAIWLAIVMPVLALYWWAVVRWWYPFLVRKLEGWLERRVKAIEESHLR